MDVKYYYVCRVGLPYMLLLMPMMFSCASSDAAQDIADCTQQLVGLATCLPYVGGNAKSPTPDCCSGLKQVLKTNKKCLCVVVRDRNDPQLGLTINVTLALGLPSVCNAPANVSNCPALLHLAPNSPEAQVFYQYGHASNSTSASSPAASVKANATTPSASSSGTSVHQDQKSDGHYNGGRRWLGLEVIAGGLLIWVFNSNLII